MRNRTKEAFKTLNIKNIFLPIIIGISIIFLLIKKDKTFTINNLLLIKNIKPIGIIGSIMMLIIRDLLYMLRIRLLVNKSVSWYKCFIIISLWEFSSCVTPSVVGGGFVAAFLFIHEGISAGQAIAYVMVTATFDNYFLLLASPLGFSYSNFDNSYISLMSHVFYVSYSLIFLYSSIMTCSLFIKPEIIKYIMVKITSIKFLQRFNKNAIENGNELINSSKFLKKRGLNFWILILFITLAAWLSRFVILNFLVEGFIDCDIDDHVQILCKHLVMWINMLISPTPGGCGFVEYFFNHFFKNTLLDHTIIISIMWRILTYYVYLFIGVIILPRWIKTFKNKNNHR